MTEWSIHNSKAKVVNGELHAGSLKVGPQLSVCQEDSLIRLCERDGNLRRDIEELLIKDDLNQSAVGSSDREG